MLIIWLRIMTAVVMTSDFAHSARMRINPSRIKKAIAVALFLACLFGAHAFADEGLSFSHSFAPLKAESALSFYFLDFTTLWSTTHFPSTTVPATARKNEKPAMTLSDWSAGLGLTAVRPFESLPLSLFQRQSTRFSRFEPGLGTYCPVDKIGRSRISGAGLEENRWLYFKIKFRF